MSRRSGSFAPALLTLAFLSFTPLRAQVDYRPWFTLQPDEGRIFVLDTTAVIDGGAGVPGLHITPIGQVILGFGRPGGPGRGTALLQENGASASILQGVRSPGQIDGGFIYLPDGRIRFVTEEPSPGNTQTRHLSRIVSWISANGLDWDREPGIRYQPGTEDDSISSVPSVLQIGDSTWRLYYVGDFYRTNGVRTAISTDWGMTWTRESDGNVLRKGDVDPHPVHLKDGRMRLYHRSGFGASPGSDPGRIGVAFTESDDGLHFDTSTTVVVIPDSTVDGMFKLDPAVIRFPTGDVACYIGAMSPRGERPGKVVVAWDRARSDVHRSGNSEASPELIRGVVREGDIAKVLLRGTMNGRFGYSLHGPDGRLVRQGEERSVSGRTTIEIDLGGLPSGYYRCVVIAGEQRAQFPLQVVR